MREVNEQPAKSIDITATTDKGVIKSLARIQMKITIIRLVIAVIFVAIGVFMCVSGNNPMVTIGDVVMTGATIADLRCGAGALSILFGAVLAITTDFNIKIK